MTGNGTRGARMLVSVLAGAVLIVVAGVATAHAHGDTGVIEVGDPLLVDALTVEFPIRITYESDGHPAEEATGLTVSGTGPDGERFGPVEPFEPGDAPGVWIARVELPSEGVWDLTIDVSDPAASVEVKADATAPMVGDPGDPPDAEPPVGAAPPAGPDDPAVTADDPAGDPADADDLATADDGDDDGDGSAVPVVIAAVVVVAAAVAGYTLLRRRG